MKKVIAAINMTLDGYCDHTAVDPDEEVHEHYADLLAIAGVALYGRVTYQLMEYWLGVLQNPTGEKAMDDFAAAIDRTPKIVFSRTLDKVDWKSARLAKRSPEAEILELKQQPGGDIYVCSPGLINSLTESGVIDEYQICIHPVIIGKGLPLFRNISQRILLHHYGTKVFKCGAVIHYFERKKD